METADVLVLGGGPSAAWAALRAAEAGLTVVVADKGHLGTSGATAPSNTGTWCLPPGDLRRAAVDQRFERTLGLAERPTLERAAETGWDSLNALAGWGYPFPRGEDGGLYMANLRGPDYMRFMRRRLLSARVRILDHHPALELLADADGIVCGARGIARQDGARWQVTAKAVVLATGGCAFGERILGATGLTGDGLVMAAEAGAEASAMEFSAKYTLAPFGSSLIKGLPYRWATFTREDGAPVTLADGTPLPGMGREGEVARAIMAGPLYACLDLAPPEIREALTRGQPNCFVPHDRRAVDPFEQRFRVGLRYEGTVRGVGGIHVAADGCSTGVAGLYAAGDAASRERMTGAISGGGSYNATWAIASGRWAGDAAADFARRRGRTSDAVRPLGGVGLVDDRRGLAATDAVEAVKAEILPLERNFFRDGGRLAVATDRLAAAWRAFDGPRAATDPADPLRAALRDREAAAMLANGRFVLAAAAARTETRGLARRADFPRLDPAQARSIVVAGLDSPTARPAGPAVAARGAA